MPGSIWTAVKAQISLPKHTAGGNRSATSLFSCILAKSAFDSRILTELMNPFCSLVRAPNESAVTNLITTVREEEGESEARAEGPVLEVSPGLGIYHVLRPLRTGEKYFSNVNDDGILLHIFVFNTFSVG